MAQQQFLSLTQAEFEHIRPIFGRAVAASRLVPDTEFSKAVRPFWVQTVEALLRLQARPETDIRRFLRASMAEQNVFQAPAGMTFERFVVILQTAKQESLRPPPGAAKIESPPSLSSRAGADVVLPRPPAIPHFSRPPVAPRPPADGHDAQKPSRSWWPWRR